MKEKISGKALKKYLGDIQNRAMVRKTDISDHLAMLFTESLNIESKLIVELGVGDGESTFVLSGLQTCGAQNWSAWISMTGQRFRRLKTGFLSNQMTSFAAGISRLVPQAGIRTRDRHFVY